MSKQTDKERIVALQKALTIARRALVLLAHGRGHEVAENALDEINKLDWMTAPPPPQGLCGHGRRT